MNAAAFSAISTLEASHYVGPINPPVILSQKAISKLLRVIGSRGNFFFFSQQRLEAIARLVDAECLADARLNFFQGFTPWILTSPRRPYVAWSDCTFRDYIDIFHQRSHFKKEDVGRIERIEAAWLKNASRVFFTSNWAAERAVTYYALDMKRVESIGIFGEMEMPTRDAYAGKKQFAFVSTNFEAKGGRIVLSAFREVRKRHPDLSLIVVGDKPSLAVAEPGLEFVGFLRKEIPREVEQFRKILAEARALVHPTRSDISPLLVIEAGYFGCPAISSRRFAVPELVDHTRTGILLDDPSSVEAVVDAMSWTIEHADEYEKMRKEAWAKAHGQHSKRQFEVRLLPLSANSCAVKDSLMKILYLGQIGHGQTALMRMRALERLGHSVRGVHTSEPWQRASWFKRQVQRRTNRGSIVEEINTTILFAARQFKPALVWADKQEFLRVETIDELRKLGAKSVHFTPDPYFSLEWKRTPLMNAAMKAFDALIYCKSYERDDYQSLGKPAIYMPLGYCDKIHRPLSSGDPRWECAIGFLGGWEPRREQLLHAVAATCSNVKIWGAYWDFLRDGRWTPRRHIILRQLAGGEHFNFHRDDVLARSWQGREVYEDDYARALTGAKIGIGFLRKAWPDQHTTRSFEIPACGSLLLADRTDEHQELFEEGKEAEFFGSCEELLAKVKFYCTNESARTKVANGGYERCKAGKYAYVHRLSAALDALERI